MTRAIYSLGLPMWANREWQGSLYPRAATNSQFLQYYSQVFNTVEGNTTFYALPSRETVDSWYKQLSPGFEFCFKLPRKITHENALRYCAVELTEFLQRVEPLGEHLGPFMIQLPDSFTPQQLPDLARFLEGLSADYTYSVEVRHLDFFNRGEEERQLNRLLHQHAVDRVCFDSRALFSQPADIPAEQDAQRKKPRLPVHAIATGRRPLVRFIGAIASQHNEPYLVPWVEKINQWVSEGLRPLFFMHTPDNARVPQEAARFHQMLDRVPGWQPLSKTISDESQLNIF